MVAYIFGAPVPFPMTLLPITGKPGSWPQWWACPEALSIIEPILSANQFVIGQRDGHMTPAANRDPSLGQKAEQLEEPLRTSTGCEKEVKPTNAATVKVTVAR